MYDDLTRMIADGVREGWAANIEVDGRKYRRAKAPECDDAAPAG
ncbi:4-hydroxylaminobenzoate lyase [Saccharopolyspora sp. 5N708]